MAVCEVCGNDYYLAFEVVTANNRHVFDSFECAIQKLAPVCFNCGCKIIGHGVEADTEYFARRTAPGKKACAAWTITSGARKRKRRKNTTSKFKVK